MRHTWSMLCLAALATMVCATASVAQPPDTLWTRTFGGENHEDASSVLETPDGGFILAGYTSSTVSGRSDFLVIRTNANGDEVWSQTYGDDNRSEDVYCMQATADGGYILIGPRTQIVTPTYNTDVYLVKIDAGGGVEWDREYGVASLGEVPGWVVPTSDGGYLFCAYYWGSSSTGYDFTVVKTTAAGDPVWDKVYAWTDAEYAYGIAETADGGYIVTGKTQSFSGDYGFEMFLLKTDASGDSTWMQRFSGVDEASGRHVRQLADGGYLVTGDREGPGYVDLYVVRTDGVGDSLWTRTFGGTYIDRGYHSVVGMDGDFVIAGVTARNSWDAYLIELSPDGSTDWEIWYGDTLRDEATAVVCQTMDGGFVTAGSSAPATGGYSDVFLARLGPPAGLAHETFLREDLGRPLRDGEPTYDTLTVGGMRRASQTAGLVGVTVWIDTLFHAATGQLTLLLEHAGVIDTLVHQAGGDGADFIGTRLSDGADLAVASAGAPFTGFYRPHEPLSAFDDLDPNGAWILHVVDGVAGTEGTLEAWGLTLVYDLVSGVGGDVAVRPEACVLEQNFPNPFNAGTSIRFSLDEPAPLNLAVYNLLGRRVATLCEGLHPAGRHQVTWDGRLHDGSEAPSGIYFCRLAAGGHAEVKKMLLLR